MKLIIVQEKSESGEKPSCGDLKVLDVDGNEIGTVTTANNISLSIGKIYLEVELNELVIKK